jgi:flagellar biosynthesis protein FlhG
LVDRGADQADGLRRMFGGARTRVLEIVSGGAGAGRTAVAVNLGAALARLGRNTLLVDCLDRSESSRAGRSLGVHAEGSRAAAVPGCRGYSVLALSRSDWLQAGPLAPSGLGTASAFGRGTAAYDWVLVNGAGVETIVAADDGRRDVLVVLSKAAASITEAYAAVKRMAVHDHRCRFRVVVNRVPSREAAARIFDNFARVARGYLELQLGLIGFIPSDPALGRAAAQGMPVLEHDPASAAAQAFGRLADLVASTAARSPAAPGHPAAAAAMGAM